MKILFAGGGTAGHINPAIAVAKLIRSKNPDAEIVFIGTEKGLEKKLVPRDGFELKTIKVRGFRRKLSPENIVAVKELLQGLIEAGMIIRKFKPDIVIGTGGYVCGPVLFMASRMKIPTLIHEQNAYPGVTNKILSRFVDMVAVSFKESSSYFKNAKKLVHTGNPIRLELLNSNRETARKKLGLEENKRLVVAMGGSRGAKKINDSVAQMLQNDYKPEDFDIILATGEVDYERISSTLKDIKYPSVKVVPYIFDAGDIYAAADIMICRAGAITVSELTALGTPSILVPSPNVTANHQEYNARSLERQGAAVVILDKDLSGSLLYRQLKELLKDKGSLRKMAANAKKIGITNSAEKIYAMMQELITRK